MAEARMAVLPTPALQHPGFEIDTSVKVSQLHVSRAGVVIYIPHPYFLYRNMRRRMWQGLNKVQVAFMPVPVSLVVGIVAAASVWVATAKQTTWVRSGWLAEILWKIDDFTHISKQLPVTVRVAYLAFGTATGVMSAFTMAQRFVLRRLLAYHGWMNERVKKSAATKIWGFILKYVYIRRIHRNLDAYQGALPTLPLPEVNDTVGRYLETVEPLLKPAELISMKEMIENFRKNEGPRLQSYLKLKWLTSPNYVSDWWLNFVYLRSRDSLLINSNWYGVMFAEFEPSRSVAARAASLTYGFVKVKILLENNTFEPQVIGGVVPLCMNQYRYIFSTTRVPGREQDVLEVTEPSDSRHAIVMYKGKFYKLPVYSPKSNKLLSPLQLEAAFKGIIDSSKSDKIQDVAERNFAALTTMNRTKWADVRDIYFEEDAFNRVSLETIESALFAVSLDDEDAPKDISEESRRYLAGNGRNRWCDKSFNIVVCSNGKCGFHVEHSWGDAPTLAHIIEWVAVTEAKRLNYDDDGHIKASTEDLDKKTRGIFKVYPAQRVNFNVSEELATVAENAFISAESATNDLDLHVEEFTDYGKNLCKKAKCSPDAWIQMALQIAYFKDQGCFEQTYEASMTRLFAKGRTETIRSCSVESCEFVQSMKDPSKDREERIRLLRKACERHQRCSHDAMCGRGVDRHLFALFVVSTGKGITSPFLKEALGRKWKLSTSQVAARQLPDKQHIGNWEDFKTPNGGFGPVADDGYGVCYCIGGENMFYFNVSSKKSCAETDSHRFFSQIRAALLEMADLFS